MTVVGVAVTVSAGDPARLFGLDLNRGDALMLVAILCYGGYTAALRMKPQMHWLSFITVLCAAAWLASLPFAAWELSGPRGMWPDLQGWAVVAFAATMPGLVAQSCFIRGTEMIGSNRAGLFINLVPIFGTLLSILILGEAFHLYHAIALVMVLGGIWLAEQSGRKRAAGS